MISLTDQTLIVLVLYNCAIENSEAYKSLILANKDKNLNVFIYNNSPEFNIEIPNTHLKHLEIVNDYTNSGVSKAYNTGAEKAKELKLNWILLLDQDTIFPAGFFEKTSESIKIFPSEKLFAPILLSNNQFLSPCSFKFNRGRISKNVILGINTFKNKSILNSGLLIEVDAFLEIGGYNEKIKLDFSDFYFLNKFQKKYNHFVLTDNNCSHDLSSSEVDINKQLVRFSHYLKGALEYGKSTNNKIQIFFLITFRTLILTIRYKSFKFLRLYSTMSIQ